MIWTLNSKVNFLNSLYTELYIPGFIQIEEPMFLLSLHSLNSRIVTAKTPDDLARI